MIYEAGLKDSAELAWARFPSQHQDKPVQEHFVRSFFTPLQAVNVSLHYVWSKTWLHNSEGAQLDGVGHIVGIARSVPEAVFLPFFGFLDQPSGRGFGQAPMRKNGEGYATSFQLNDAEYRRIIRAKIIQNNGHGTTEEILESARILYDTDAITVVRTGTAALTIRVGRVVSNSEPLYRLREKLLPVAAGVSVTITTG